MRGAKTRQLWVSAAGYKESVRRSFDFRVKSCCSGRDQELGNRSGKRNSAVEGEPSAMNSPSATACWPVPTPVPWCPASLGQHMGFSSGLMLSATDSACVNFATCLRHKGRG